MAMWTRRDLLRRGVAAGAVALGGPVVLGACQSTGGGNSLDAAKEAGRIKVGFAGEAPYGYTDETGKFTGEAPEVARVVFKALGINEMEAVHSNFDGLIPALNASQFDMVAAGMFITPKRCENAAFSIPDYTTLSAFLVPKGNPQVITKYEDIAAKKVKVAVLSGAVEKGYATGAGVPEDFIVTADTQDNLLRNVLDNRVYCGALTDISLNDLVKRNPTANVEVTKGFSPVDASGKKIISAGGFVFRKGDDPLRDAFSTELRKLHESGEWVRIVEPFGFTQDNLPPDGLTTEQLCTA